MNVPMRATYCDWSKGQTDAEAWRMCNITPDRNEMGELELYLERPAKLLTTFVLVLDEKNAQALRDYLNKEYPNE
jgi:hypothetical protein